SFPFVQRPPQPAWPHKLRSPHFVDRVVGMTDDVELVINNPALRRPLRQALLPGRPHIHTGRLDRPPLAQAQLRAEILIQGLLLAFPPEPERFRRLQIADSREESGLLSQVDLIYAHLPECRRPPPGVPSRQKPLINCSHGALRQPVLPRHLPDRCALARHSYGVLESFTERRLARQQWYLLHLHAAVRALHPIHFDVHRGLEHSPRQVPHCPPSS